MKKIQRIAVFLTAVTCFQFFSACSKKGAGSENSESKKKTQTIIGVKEDSETETDTSAGISEDGWITPSEDSEEYELGRYCISDKGIKLYYDEEEYPEELILALEKYFKSFEEKDYASYCECVYPSYIDKMEEFLQKDYGYGLNESFDGQCENLSGNMGGSFEITRIKAEKSEDFETEEAGADSYLEMLDETFGGSYDESVKSECDNMRYLRFYVMAKDADGVESMLVSGFDILFAEKDGKYYTFG
ncbi:MAG: hypothetical protein NC485_01615 [Ruminococcus flavefaciens]|nr:hypothetical protein [Ruminococcus flavefaciens]